MKWHACLCAAVAVGMVAVNASAAPGAAPTHGARIGVPAKPSAPGASPRAVITRHGSPARSAMPTNRAVPGTFAKVGGPASGTGKGISTINGTTMGARH